MSRSTDLTEVYVLRRVHRDHFQDGAPVEILPVAFRPNARDTDGISVSFEAEVTPIELASAQGKDPQNYCVVRLAVSDLQQLGLTVVPDKSPDAPPGHAFIPEVNPVEYRRDKKHIKELSLQLARLATSDIVWQPAHAS